MSTRAKVDQEKFDFVKKLIETGMRITQISEISGLSDCTVTNIRSSVDLDEYRNIVAKQFAKKRAYDLAKAGVEGVRPSGKPVEPVKVQTEPNQSYTVTMVIGTDEEHQKYIAPLTALVNALFESNNVAVECKRADA